MGWNGQEIYEYPGVNLIFHPYFYRSYDSLTPFITGDSGPPIQVPCYTGPSWSTGKICTIHGSYGIDFWFRTLALRAPRILERRNLALGESHLQGVGVGEDFPEKIPVSGGPHGSSYKLWKDMGPENTWVCLRLFHPYKWRYGTLLITGSGGPALCGPSQKAIVQCTAWCKSNWTSMDMGKLESRRENVTWPKTVGILGSGNLPDNKMPEHFRFLKSNLM